MITRTNGRVCALHYTAVRPYKCRHYTDEWRHVAYCAVQWLYDSAVWGEVQGWLKGGIWGGGLPPPQLIVIKLILSPPNTPFLFPVPIIYHAIIITIRYSNIFFSHLCVVCFIGRCNSRFRLKRTSECHRPSEKNVPKPHTPPIPGHDLKYTTG